MRILLISTSFNSFTQRVLTDLIGAGHEGQHRVASWSRRRGALLRRRTHERDNALLL
jgi:hypothetical protein